MSLKQEDRLKGRSRPRRISTASAEAFAARLAEIAKRFGSANGLARRLGVSPNTVSNWLRGLASPSRENLIRIARAANLRVGYVAAGEGDLRPVNLPRDFWLPASDADGAPEIAFLDSEWDRLLAQSPQRSELTLMRMKDDTMEPTLRAGDLLLYDPLPFDQLILRRPNGIYVLCDHTVRRVLWRSRTRTALISFDNKKYAVANEELPFGGVELRGRVIWRGGML